MACALTGALDVGWLKSDHCRHREDVDAGRLRHSGLERDLVISGKEFVDRWPVAGLHVAEAAPTSWQGVLAMSFWSQIECIFRNASLLTVLAALTNSTELRDKNPEFHCKRFGH